MDDSMTFAINKCVALATFDVIAHRWSALVIYALSRGLRRHTELRADITEISQKILTETLRRLERDGLVTRTVFPTVPPRVDYELTALGHSLRDTVEAVGRWAVTNHPAIRAAQSVCDQRVAKIE